jgi:hypothetical protein
LWNADKKVNWTNMGCAASTEKEEEYQVIVHVYERSNTGVLTGLFRAVTGCGLFHTGCEIRPVNSSEASSYEAPGVEYAFGPSNQPGTGVWEQIPKQLPSDREETGLFNKYKQELPLGVFRMKPQKLKKAISFLKREWHGQQYDPLTRNCNHFTNAVCLLFVGKEIPKWINKLAGVGNSVMQSMARGLSTANSPPLQITLDTYSKQSGVTLYTASESRM